MAELQLDGFLADLDVDHAASRGKAPASAPLADNVRNLPTSNALFCLRPVASVGQPGRRDGRKLGWTVGPHHIQGFALRNH